MKLVHVLVIEDSIFTRRKIVGLLETDSRINVIGTAKNSMEGFKKIESLSPDVVILDTKDAKKNRAKIFETINNINPIPVIILSGIETEIDLTMWQENVKGLVDFISLPTGATSQNVNELKEEMIDKVINASKRNIQQSTVVKEKLLMSKNSERKSNAIVVIGASTGGPRALQKILTELPKDFPAPILIVQHMPPNFTKTLAERLSSLSAIKVKEAENGEKVNTGIAYIAPGDFHMKVKKEKESLAIELTKFPDDLIYRPSVDILFQSASSIDNVHIIAVILTGMGKDGSEGIKNIKKNNSSVTIIAESKETSIVYGMPKAALETGTVDEVIHLQKIANRMLDIIKKK